jgi:hypothetical protein
MKSVDVLAEFVSSVLAVRGRAARQQLGRLEGVILRTSRLERVDGEQVAELR